MQHIRNPFTPTFGIVPQVLAGRSDILNDMDTAFEDGLGNPNLSTILVGARGTGKTALLSCIADEAQQRGWISATVVAIPGMLDDVIQRTLEAASEFLEPKRTKRLTGLEIAQVLGLEWTTEPSEQANWRTRMSSILHELNDRSIGLLI